MKKSFLISLVSLAPSILLAPTPPSSLSHNETLILRLQQRIEDKQNKQLTLRKKAEKLAATAIINRQELEEVDIATERALVHTLNQQATLQHQEHTLKNKLPFSRTTLALSRASTPSRPRAHSH